jgi:hypothetical protein
MGRRRFSAKRRSVEKHSKDVNYTNGSVMKYNVGLMTHVRHVGLVSQHDISFYI